MRHEIVHYTIPFRPFSVCFHILHRWTMRSRKVFAHQPICKTHYCYRINHETSPDLTPPTSETKSDRKMNNMQNRQNRVHAVQAMSTVRLRKHRRVIRSPLPCCQKVYAAAGVAMRTDFTLT